MGGIAISMQKTDRQRFNVKFFESRYQLPDSRFIERFQQLARW
jgi:hypothetical protein